MQQVVTPRLQVHTLPSPHLEVVTPRLQVHTLSIPHLQRFHFLEVNQQETHLLQPEVEQAAEGIR